MDWISVPTTVLIIFGTIYKVFELFVRKEERKMIINKIEDIKGVDLSGTNLNMENGQNNKFLPLRIGMLILGVGLGCFTAILAMTVIMPRINDQISTYYTKQMLSGACICFFGGLALVLSYIIEHKTRCRENGNKEGRNN